MVRLASRGYSPFISPVSAHEWLGSRSRSRIGHEDSGAIGPSRDDGVARLNSRVGLIYNLTLFTRSGVREVDGIPLNPPMQGGTDRLWTRFKKPTAMIRPHCRAPVLRRDAPSHHRRHPDATSSGTGPSR